MRLQLGFVHNPNTFIRLQLALPTLKDKSDTQCAMTIACFIPVLTKSINLKNLYIRNKLFPRTRSLSLCSLTDSEHCCHNHNHIYNHAHCGLVDRGPGVHDRWAEPCWPQELARQAPSLSIVPRVSQANRPNCNKEPFYYSFLFAALASPPG